MAEPADPRDWDVIATLRLIDLLAGRWVLAIVRELHGADRLRRRHLRGALPGVSDKVLTETLRRLEEHGLVNRYAIASVPVEVDYALTELAATLVPVITTLHRWAADHPFDTGPSPTSEDP